MAFKKSSSDFNGIGATTAHTERFFRMRNFFYYILNASNQAHTFETVKKVQNVQKSLLKESTKLQHKLIMQWPGLMLFFIYKNK